MGFFSWTRNRQRRSSGGSTRSQGSSGQRFTFRPRLEALEDRWMPSTLTVNYPGDSPYVPGSLRSEIRAAQSGDTIVFAPYLHTISLGSGFGELYMMNKNLTIKGPGADKLTITAAGKYPSRVFEVYSGSVTLSGLTISGGNGLAGYGWPGAANDGKGGAILNDYGNLTISGCTISNNSADYGGGIANLVGALTVSQSALSGNSAWGTLYEQNWHALGGGIYTTGRTATLTNCTFANNSALRGGGLYLGGRSTATLTNCTLSLNSGGGIFIGFNTIYIDPFTVAHTVNNTDVSGTNGSTANIDGTYILLP